MSLLSDLVSDASSLAHIHLAKIAFALTATVLATYGDVVNRAVRRRIAHLPLVARTAIFVGLAGFGYGTFVVLAAPVVAKLLLLFGPFWLAPSAAAAFVGVGMLAERRKKI